ncbi:hypothetical protein CFC21_111632 [Triticum aestivum]|uniref:BLE2 protein n=2 Tax=Triticum aestivum TaxID=4565 RepID=A0A9R1MQF4_WHEAT|nr:uncharacterized protein LOC123169508 [Triticum aestivum]KAF7111650.1 hypothetical protein CFC21_111632 [Triticum aestivum]
MPGERQGRSLQASMRAERWLNAFVRMIALLERVGNALGTLAFIWGTVVVLGGFAAYLGTDFWVATVIVFLEGFRAFSRESSSDDQFLFKTTGGINLERTGLGTRSGSLNYANAVIMTACMLMLPALEIIHYRSSVPVLQDSDGVFLLMLVVTTHKLGFYTLIGYISTNRSHILLHFIPAASLLLVWVGHRYLEGYCLDYCGFVYLNHRLILLWFSIYILARFGSPGDGCPYHRMVKVVARLFRIILLGVVIWRLSGWFGPMGLLALLSPLVLGNLQIPMALARIMFSYVWLVTKDIEVHETKNQNVIRAVQMLYIVVMCQGILYCLACILEPLSFLQRRSLALDCKLSDKLGMESIDLYYEQAFDTFLKESVFDSTKKVDLATFAVDSLNPMASRDRKRAAVRILASFLQSHATSSTNDTNIISLITTSTDAVTTLISMLEWTVTEDADIRLFATKVTAQLAPNLRIIGIPGTMHKISLLLDAQDQPIIQNSPAQIVLGNGGNTDNQQSTNASATVDQNRRNIGRQQTRMRSALSFLRLDIEGGNAPEVPGRSRICKFLLFLMEEICKFGEHIEKLLSIPHKESEDNDSLPVLGMQILEGLAHDIHNCAEISRATELLPKIIEFMSFVPGTVVEQRQKIAMSSLRLVAKLGSIKGKIGITLVQDLSENPLLIGNLTEILELEENSNPEQVKLAMDIIAKIAVDKKTRQKIWTVQVIIDKLLNAFLLDDESLAPLAGEALAMLATESPVHCSGLLVKRNYELIRDLADKLQRSQHVYPAASLLQRFCENSTQLLLAHQDSRDRLSSTLTVVLGRIVDVEGKQMEALISLASQICSAGITPVLNSSANAVPFVEKLVRELKARKIPGADEFPDMRRLLVQLTLSIAEYCDGYAFIFKQHGMMDVLSKVEQYMGLVSEEHGALNDKVARAKGLIDAATS